MGRNVISKDDGNEKKREYHRNYYHNKYKNKVLDASRGRTNDKVECPLCKCQVTRHYLLKHQSRPLCERRAERIEGELRNAG